MLHLVIIGAFEEQKQARRAERTDQTVLDLIEKAPFSWVHGQVERKKLVDLLDEHYTFTQKASTKLRTPSAAFAQHQPPTRTPSLKAQPQHHRYSSSLLTQYRLRTAPTPDHPRPAATPSPDIIATHAILCSFEHEMSEIAGSTCDKQTPCALFWKSSVPTRCLGSMLNALVRPGGAARW